MPIHPASVHVRVCSLACMLQCTTCHKYLFSGVDGGKAVMLDDKLYCRKHAELVRVKAGWFVVLCWGGDWWRLAVEVCMLADNCC